MDLSLEAILEEMARSIATLTFEHTRSIKRLRNLASKLAQIDRRLVRLERMVKN